MSNHVKVYMTNGWQQLGGILIDEGKFYQTMVLYESEEKT